MNQQDEQRERVPLGIPTTPRPEIGPTVKRYYRQKYAAGPGSFGKYYPLHLTASLDRDDR